MSVYDWLVAAAPYTTAAVGIVALVVQKRSNDRAQKAQSGLTDRALEAQSHAGQEARDHEIRLVKDERLWSRRAELYSTICDAARTAIEDWDADATHPGKDPALRRLVSETEVFGSQEMASLIGRFVYDQPGYEDANDLWATLQSQARHELLG